MGEIIIKVPEDVHEVIDLGLPYKKVKEKIEEATRLAKFEQISEKIEKYLGRFIVEEGNEEEIYR